MISRRKRLRGLIKLSCLCGGCMVVVGCATVSDEPPIREAFSFVQLCDPQLGAGGYEHDVKTFQQAVDQINERNPDFVVICGDLVARANDKSVHDFQRIKAGLAVPSYCVPGNHDLLHGPYDRRAGYSADDSLRHYRQSFGKDYYVVDHKGYRFVCVNTQLWRVHVEGESEKHDSWVKTALKQAAEEKIPVFVVGHHPLYVKDVSEPDGYNNLPLEKRKELLALYVETGVVAVLGGHLHRLKVNNHNGIQWVNGESTSRMHGGALGFRLWHINGEPPFKHVAVPLAKIEAEKPADTAQ